MLDDALYKIKDNVYVEISVDNKPKIINLNGLYGELQIVVRDKKFVKVFTENDRTLFFSVNTLTNTNNNFSSSFFTIPIKNIVEIDISKMSADDSGKLIETNTEIINAQLSK